METGNARNDDSSQGSAGSLDTALLETIFYNEMMLLGDGSSSLSSDFLAYLSSDPTSSLTNNSSCVETAPADASAIAERALLSDFGVSHTNSESSASASVPATSPSPLPSSEAVSLEAVTTPASNNNISDLRTAPNRTTVVPSHSTAPAQQLSPIPAITTTATVRPPTRPTSSTFDAPPSTLVPQERAKQLVSQFATLASRLGVSLPQNLLQSLVASAAIKEANKTGEETALTPSSQPAVTGTIKIGTTPVASSQEKTTPFVTASATGVSSAIPSSSSQIPPEVKEIADTAQAAISAVLETRKRGHSSESSAAPANKPLYSKRRKKPRLVDCESKLASLRAENEMLKRHLENVTNKSNKFLNERKRAEKDLQKLTKEGAGNEQINPVIHNYSEMYSDYGRHRNQELTFHLEQLGKLAAPTNFTKMGLWSLGQNEGFYTNPKQNPIAGILRKELNITPAQGRKIIEQRTKIRNLVGNLNECVMLLGKLKGLCEHKQKVFKDRMTKCQEILTPQQVAKLMLWIDQHSDTLESVCPGWGSERIRGKGSDEKAK